VSPQAREPSVSRRTTILVAASCAALAIAGLAVPGAAGGALLLVLVILLAAMTSILHARGVRLDGRNWTLRALVVLILTAIGLAKIFH